MAGGGSFEPTHAEVIRDGVKGGLDEVHTMKVGRVIRFDPDKDVVDVQITTRRAVNIGSGEVEFESYPPIPNVPIAWPRAGGYFIHLPIAVGDTIVLGFTDDNIAEWRSTGSESEPDDLVRHGLGSALALVGIYEMLKPLSQAPKDAAARAAGLCLGKDGDVDQICWSPLGMLIGRDAIDPVVLSIPMLAHIAKQSAALTSMAATLALMAAAFGKLATVPVITPIAGDACTAAAGGCTATAALCTSAAVVPDIGAKRVKAM